MKKYFPILLVIFFLCSCSIRYEVKNGPRGQLLIKQIRGQGSGEHYYSLKREEAYTDIYVDEAMTLKQLERKLQSAIEKGDAEEIEKWILIKRRVADSTAELENYLQIYQYTRSLLNSSRGSGISRSQKRKLLRYKK